MFNTEQRAWNYLNHYQWVDREGDAGCAHMIAFARLRHKRAK